MKKITLAILLFFFVVAFFLAVQFFGSIAPQRGALQVTSVPESKVYLNDKYLGQTPLCKCEATDMLDTGEYTVRLSPVDKSFTEFQEKIKISKGILTVVDRKFGKDALSEGSVISLSPLADKSKIEFVAVSFPRDASVFLDSQEIGRTPLLYKNVTESDHILKIKKSGYNEKSIRIRTQVGYRLEVAVYLSTSAKVAKPLPTASSSTSVETTPTVQPTPHAVQLLILNTPTGFLRVRRDPAVNSPEIGRVKPGETYPLLNEKEDWYEIVLEDGKNGWITSQYATKQ